MTRCSRTLPGRAIVIGLGDQAARVRRRRGARARVPAFLTRRRHGGGRSRSPSGAAYFLFRLLVLAKRRLLWRVRRKLILSYIFIGFVPAILIVAFFLLCGLLLFYNFSSYLVQTPAARAERAGALPRRRARRSRFSARAAATSPASSARRQANAAARVPGHLDRRRAGRPALRAAGERRPPPDARRPRRRRPPGRGRTSTAPTDRPGLDRLRRLVRAARVRRRWRCERPQRADRVNGRPELGERRRHAHPRARRRVSRFAAARLRGRRRSARRRPREGAAAAGDRRRAEERERVPSDRDGREAARRARRRRAGVRDERRPRAARTAVGQLPRVPRLETGRGGHARRVHAAQHRRASTIASRPRQG